MPEAGIVILAGGEGRRIGGQKPERLLRGRRLIDIAVARASCWNAPVVVSVRRKGQAPAIEPQEILDRVGIEGPLAGLLAAIDWAKQANVDRFLTIPCDMPLLPDDLMPRLLESSVAEDRPAVACCDGQRHPICAVWPRSAFDKLEDYASTGDRSLAGALVFCSATEVVWRVECSDQFININRPEDLRKIVGASIR